MSVPASASTLAAIDVAVGRPSTMLSWPATLVTGVAGVGVVGELGGVGEEVGVVGDDEPDPLAPQPAASRLTATRVRTAFIATG